MRTSPSTRRLWTWIQTRQMQFVVDLTVLVAAFVVAYLLRFEFRLEPRFVRMMLIQLPVVVLTQYGALMLTGAYSIIWRYVGLAEVRVFVRAALYSLTPLLVLRIGLPDELQQWRVPLSVLLVDSMLAFGGLLSLRVLRRVLYESDRQRQRSSRARAADAQPVLLIGAGQAGVLVARELRHRSDLGLEVVGFVDDDPRKIGSVINGIRVLGSAADIPRLVEELRVDHVILTIAEPSRRDIRRIVEICERVPIRARVIPGLYELIDGSVEINRIRNIQIEDLLGREPVVLEEETLERFLRGRRLLVTGAGGSIGSELARQSLRFGPAGLVLVERSEFALFEIERQLREARDLPPLHAVLADAANGVRMEAVFRQYRPDVVLHAAAHKHVPMMEYHPGEAVRNNTLATADLATLAGRHGCEAFVLVSTDKAVRPASIMGASKRLAELAVQDLSRRHPATRFIAVRFGNVLGSTGSVIPIFRQQIERGGPVTVTHPSVERYFMTPSEAAQLVLQAGAIGESGEILVLDMGEPVSITELALDMIQLAGLKPYEEIDIVYTGLRPGEKLHEELEVAGESIAKTRHPKIFVGRIEVQSSSRIDFALRRLRELADREEHAAIRAVLAELLPESTIAALQPPAQLGETSPPE